MLRGFYTAASGMITQQRHQEALSNNIANANTPGFKADQSSSRAFPELFMQQMGSKNILAKNSAKLRQQKPIGSLHTGVYVQEMVPNHHQGDLKETQAATDLAIIQSDVPDETGSLFFTVQNEAGEQRYTRNGNFTVDAQGFLVTNEGYDVLDESLNRIQTNGSDFTVAADGELEADGQRLGIAYVPDVNELTKEGNNLFRGDAGEVPAEARFRVRQGVLERSNVDELQAMTQMMESYRMFETNQRVLKAYDENMGKAVSEIGRLG
ncbi:flagellar hook-basal body protein [Virgibacillus alimentarius]|uniref:flagellar hook-basal body protein n=1 Tax=Virgibacillus alimentarius TaxID=698769 RepID=UPI00049360D9|nr:flagellar hook-basal body protein [Virgibacillus alimentarius]